MYFFFRHADTKQWIQIDFGHPERIAGVLIQGRQELPQWVESYTVGMSLDGAHWYEYTDLNAQTSPTRFSGNYDQSTPVPGMFDREIDARFVRIYPKTWHNTIAMRFEVLSCYGAVNMQTTLQPPLVSGQTPTAIPPWMAWETPTAQPQPASGATPTAEPGKFFPWRSLDLKVFNKEFYTERKELVPSGSQFFPMSVEFL